MFAFASLLALATPACTTRVTQMQATWTELSRQPDDRTWQQDESAIRSLGGNPFCGSCWDQEKREAEAEAADEVEATTAVTPPELTQTAKTARDFARQICVGRRERTDGDKEMRASRKAAIEALLLRVDQDVQSVAHGACYLSVALRAHHPGSDRIEESVIKSIITILRKSVEDTTAKPVTLRGIKFAIKYDISQHFWADGPTYSYNVLNWLLDLVHVPPSTLIPAVQRLTLATFHLSLSGNKAGVLDSDLIKDNRAHLQKEVKLLGNIFSGIRKEESGMLEAAREQLEKGYMYLINHMLSSNSESAKKGYKAFKYLGQEATSSAVVAVGAWKLAEHANSVQEEDKWKLLKALLRLLQNVFPDISDIPEKALTGLTWMCEHAPTKQTSVLTRWTSKIYELTTKIKERWGTLCASPRINRRPKVIRHNVFG